MADNYSLVGGWLVFVDMSLWTSEVGLDVKMDRISLD